MLTHTPRPPSHPKKPGHTGCPVHCPFNSALQNDTNLLWLRTGKRVVLRLAFKWITRLKGGQEEVLVSVGRTAGFLKGWVLFWRHSGVHSGWPFPPYCLLLQTPPLPDLFMLIAYPSVPMVSAVAACVNDSIRSLKIRDNKESTASAGIGHFLFRSFS